MSPLRKVLYLGLKSSNVLVINNPDLKVGVRQIAKIQGFSPTPFMDRYFSEWTQVLQFIFTIINSDNFRIVKIIINPKSGA